MSKLSTVLSLMRCDSCDPCCPVVNWLLPWISWLDPSSRPFPLLWLLCRNEWFGGEPGGRDYGWRFGGERFWRTLETGKEVEGCIEQMLFSSTSWKHLFQLLSKANCSTQSPRYANWTVLGCCSSQMAESSKIPSFSRCPIWLLGYFSMWIFFQYGLCPDGFYSPLCLRSAGTDFNVTRLQQGALTESSSVLCLMQIYLIPKSRWTDVATGPHFQETLICLYFIEKLQSSGWELNQL